MDGDHSPQDYKPQIGLEFNSEDDAYDFYNEYAGNIGFSIRIEYTNKCKKTQQITSRKFVCSKEGFRAPDKRDGKIKYPRAETRTGCLAYMTITFNKKSEKYKVYSFLETHNHPLHIQECGHMMRSQRKISEVQGIQADLAEASGITLRSYELARRQTSGREFLGFTQRDLKNYLWTKRHKSLEFGEAGALLTYFEEQSLLNPSFHYAIQLDVEEQITNIFWADAKMVLDYSIFGDMVSFDTTYRTNKESRPLGVFVGFNNYRQTVVFGGALLYDETVPSFQWLFESFLKAMGWKKPKTIFTDQDQAMAKAISLVMPETYHRLCIWHMMQNAVKHLGNLFKGDEENGAIKNELKAFIYNYEEETDFDKAWEAMLEKHEKLLDNKWLRGIYGVREKWGKPYVKRTWSAWAETTQVSESFNSKIKKYLPTNLGIIHFFEHFERVVDATRYVELEREYDSREKLPRVVLRVPLLIDAGETYTENIFELHFKDEYAKSLSAIAWKRDENNSLHEYVVKIPNEVSREVRGNPQFQEVLCTCMLFETCGILCGYAMKALDLMNIKMIPEHYKLKRLAKNAKDGILQDINKSIGTQVNTNLEASARYNMLCRNLVKLGCRAAESPETFYMVSQFTAEMAKKVEDVLCQRASACLNDNPSGAPSSSLNE